MIEKELRAMLLELCAEVTKLEKAVAMHVETLDALAKRVAALEALERDDAKNSEKTGEPS